LNDVADRRFVGLFAAEI